MVISDDSVDDWTLFGCLDNKGKDGNSEFLIPVSSNFVKRRNLIEWAGLWRVSVLVVLCFSIYLTTWNFVFVFVFFFFCYFHFLILWGKDRDRVFLITRIDFFFLVLVDFMIVVSMKFGFSFLGFWIMFVVLNWFFIFCLMQQDIAEACGVSDKALEEQERSAAEADEERFGSITPVWAGPDCQNSGTM